MRQGGWIQAGCCCLAPDPIQLSDLNTGVRGPALEGGSRRWWFGRGGRKRRKIVEGRDSRQEAGCQGRSVPQVPDDEIGRVGSAGKQVGGGVGGSAATIWTGAVMGEADVTAVLVQGFAVP